jgi:hypothetical protein
MEKENKFFKEWVNKNRNYSITLDEFINTDGVTKLYKDNKFMLMRLNEKTTRDENIQTIRNGAASTELCLAFYDDKKINFINPIDKFLKNFIIYGIYLIKEYNKMHQIEVLGVSVFKNKKKYHSNVRFHPPTQGPGANDVYYTDIKECIIKGNMNKKFYDIPLELWDIFNSDIEKQRKK